ncbi:MAG TPA: hypothetical protein VGE94_17870, partial [Chloroflexota bacterium]
MSAIRFASLAPFRRGAALVALGGGARRSPSPEPLRWSPSAGGTRRSPLPEALRSSSSARGTRRSPSPEPLRWSPS